MLEKGENNEEKKKSEMIDIEEKFEKLENELSEVNKNDEEMKRNLMELKEMKKILRKNKVLFDEKEGGMKENEYMKRDIISEEFVERKNKYGNVKIGFVDGVILRERIKEFERMMWREWSGKVLLRKEEIE